MDIPTMTPDAVHDYLQEIGRGWSGKGIAMELGCWLGSSSYALLSGLVSAGYDKPYYCYDQWRATRQEVIKAKVFGIDIERRQNLLPMFLKNVSSMYKNIEPYRGRIEKELKWNFNTPIEICLFDAPKTNPVFGYAMKQVGPAFIQGAILGLLDFYWFERGGSGKEGVMVQYDFINRYAYHFKKIKDWRTDCSCAFFKYLGGIRWGKVKI